MAPSRKRSAAQREPSEVSEAESEHATQRRRVSVDEADGRYEDGGEGMANGDSNLEHMVKNLVRLALASEYSRTAIRRSDINAKVLGAHTRQFKAVFAEAQTQLRTVFGMEMSELPVRDKITIAQKRQAAKQQSVQKSSSAWILTSTLATKFKDPDILPPPQVPTAEAESQYAALYTFVVSLIMLSGGTLADTKLERYLSRANINENTPFANSLSFNTMDKTEKILRRMEKDGYVVKVRDNSSGEELIEWIVGPRGKVEIRDLGVSGLVRTVYGEVDDAAELERRLQRSLGALETKRKGDGQEAKKRGRKARVTNGDADGEDDEELEED